MIKTVAILSGFAAMVAASPLAYPQNLDFAAIVSSAGPPPTATIAVGAASQVVSVNAASIVSAAAAQITSAPLANNYVTSSAIPTLVQKRYTESSTCDGGNVQPTGAGPVPVPDTPSAFLKYPAFHQAARTAQTPLGYVNSFTDLSASNNAYGYLGYTTLPSYDVASCSKKCDNMFGCAAFNIYFERDPSVDPGSGTNCDDPSSTTNIKCVFWGGPVTAANAVNSGQWRDDFEVVIAGSNGYINQTVDDAYGYTGPVYLGNAAINAPDDCNGANTYMGYKMWNDGLPFDVERCAAACTSQSDYNTATAPAETAAQTCQYFNTYLLEKNGITQGQICSLYSESWGTQYAVNTGYTWNSDVYSIAMSYTFSNTTNPGTCTVSGSGSASSKAKREVGDFAEMVANLI